MDVLFMMHNVESAIEDVLFLMHYEESAIYDALWKSVIKGVLFVKRN